MYACDINDVCCDKPDYGYEIGRGNHIKQVCIGGEWFDVPRYTVATPISQFDGCSYLYNMHVRPLSDCYAKPSSAKRNIYHDWCNWARENGAVAYGVGGYNCMQFTFEALLADSNGNYYAYIIVTRDNQRAIPFAKPKR